MAGNYAYVADGYEGMRVIDVTQPSAPAEVGFWNELTYGESIDGIATRGNHVYAACSEDRLYVIDVSNPSAPSTAGFCWDGGRALAISESGNYAYVAAWGELIVVDVSNPTVPVEVGSLPGLSCYDVAVAGDYAYVTEAESGLHVINISDPSHPVESGEYTYAHAVPNGFAIAENYAYVVDAHRDLRVINIVNPIAPTEIGSYETGRAQSVAIAGNYAYVASGWSGVRVIDITNSATPVEVSFCDTLGTARDVAVSGNYAYVAGLMDGLGVVDITNPAAPNLIGSCETVGTDQGIVVQNNYAYVTVDTNSLRVIDVSDPSTPTEVWAGSTWGGFDVAISGIYAYVAYSNGWWSWVVVYDISNPAAPEGVYSINTPGYAQGVAVAGNYLYVTARTSGLITYDITDLSAPVRISEYYPPYARRVHVTGNYAYITGEEVGLCILDIEDPASPVLVGYYDTPGSAQDITVVVNLAYVADEAYLGIYDVSAALGTSPQPEVVAGNFKLHSAYPNPFNATTQIRFEVPRSSHMNVAIYDLQGRLVETIASRLFAAGTHSLAYDASRRASGVYFVSMQCGEFSAAQKIVVLR